MSEAGTGLKYSRTQGLKNTAMRGPATHGIFRTNQHLDASILMHHDDVMRTTVTLDPDVDRLLKEEMRRSGTTFRQALNQAIRRALAGSVGEERRSFKLRPKRLSLRQGVDPAMLQHLEEELEIESFIQKTRKLLKS